MAAELCFLEVAVSESESKERVGTGNPQYAVFVQGPHYEPGRFSSTLYAYMDECTKKTGPPSEEGRPRPGGRVPSRTTKELFGRALVRAPSLAPRPRPAQRARVVCSVRPIVLRRGLDGDGRGRLDGGGTESRERREETEGRAKKRERTERVGLGKKERKEPKRPIGLGSD